MKTIIVDTDDPHYGEVHIPGRGKVISGHPKRTPNPVIGDIMIVKGVRYKVVGVERFGIGDGGSHLPFGALVRKIEAPE